MIYKDFHQSQKLGTASNTAWQLRRTVGAPWPSARFWLRFTTPKTSAMPETLCEMVQQLLIYQGVYIYGY